MGKKISILILYILFFFYQFEVFSQVVDIESQRFSKNEKGVFGKFELNGSYTQNKQTIWQLSNQSKILIENKTNNFLIFGDFGLLKGENEELINRGFGHLRFNQNLVKNARLKLEVFQQTQYNRIQKIKLRNLTGTGLRLKPFKTDSIDFYIGLSIMYEYEEIQEQTTPNRDARFSSYFSLDFPLGKSVTLNNIFYYQPLANQFLDFRISNQTALKIAFNKNLGFKLTFNYLEDSNPPIGIPNRIITVENGFSFSF